MLRLIVAAAVLAAAVPAAAEDWYFINVTGAAPDRRVGLLDAASINRTDPQKPVFKATLLYEKPWDNGTRAVVSTQAIDCAAKTTQIVYIEGVDLDGWSILAQGYKETPRAIVPNTAADDQRIAVCEGRWVSNTRALGETTLSSIAEQYFGG